MPAFLNISSLYKVDFRTLAFFRVALGSTLLWDLAERAKYLTKFYTNDGVLPNHFNLFHPAVPGVSLLNAFSTPYEVGVVFVLIALLYLAYTVGFGGWIVRFFTLVASVSITLRNIQIENGGQLIQCILLSWTLFLPLDRYFSLSAWRSARGRPDCWAPFSGGASEVTSFLYFGALWSLALIYHFNARTKLGITWHDGTAIYYALHISPHTTEFGHWLRQNLNSELGSFLSRGALVLEWFLPFAILSPIYRNALSLIALCGIWLLHGGIFLTMSLGIFPVILPVYALLLLNRYHWNWIVSTIVRIRPVEATDLSIKVKSSSRVAIVLTSGYGILLFACVTLQSWAEYSQFVDKEQAYNAPPWSSRMTEYLRIQQHWRMFSPEVPKTDYAIICEGELADGRRIDLDTGKHFRRNDWRLLSKYFDEPQHSDSYNLHWQLRTIFSFFRSHPDSLMYYGKYWKRRYPDLKRYWILHIERQIPPPGTSGDGAVTLHVLAESDSHAHEVFLDDTYIVNRS